MTPTLCSSVHLTWKGNPNHPHGPEDLDQMTPCRNPATTTRLTGRRGKEKPAPYCQPCADHLDAFRARLKITTLECWAERGDEMREQGHIMPTLTADEEAACTPEQTARLARVRAALN